MTAENAVTVFAANGFHRQNPRPSVSGLLIFLPRMTALHG